MTDKHTEKHTETHACDLIDRQAAIDGINKLMEIHFDRRVVLKKARDVVEQLPPAQPEEARIQKMQDLEQAEIQKAYELGKLDAMDEIVKCKDCKHKHIENSVWVCPFGLSGGPEFFCGYGAERQEE